MDAGGATGAGDVAGKAALVGGKRPGREAGHVLAGVGTLVGAEGAGATRAGGAAVAGG